MTSASRVRRRTLALVGYGRRCGRRLDRIARAGAARRDSRYSTLVRRPRRPAAAALHDAGRPLAAAGDARRCRSALTSRCCWPTRTSAFATHRGVDPAGAWRARLGSWSRNGRIVSGGSTLTMQVARLLEPRAERTLAAKLRQMVRAIEIERRLQQGRDPRALSQPRALWRQSGGRSRRVARLFRQGAAPADARRGRAAGGAAAIAGAAPARPLGRGSARRARPRARSRRRSRPAAGRRDRARQARAGAGRAPADADAGAACRRRGGRRSAGARIHRLTIDAALQRSLEELARERARALGPIFRSRSSRSTTRRGEVLARVGVVRLFRQRAAPARST